MPSIQLPGGFTVRTFQSPPPGFDSVKATDRERLVYGLPRCPVENPELVARWTQKLNRPYQMVQPEFKTRESRKKSLSSFLGKRGTQQFENWAGAFVTPPSGTTFKWVESTWRFPQSYLPDGAQPNVEYFASTWIGIDGDNDSTDILQAGCDSDVEESGGSNTNQYNPWWEWFPAGSFWINNLTFSPGDEIALLICVTLGSTTSAAVFFGNNTTNKAAYFHATPPAGTTLVGNSAEWIVEALTSSPGYTLAKFDTVLFTDCNAGTASGASVQSGTGGLIDMIDSSSRIIANSSLIGTTEVQVKYTGP